MVTSPAPESSFHASRSTSRPSADEAGSRSAITALPARWAVTSTRLDQTAQQTSALHLRHPDVARRRGWVVPTYSLVVPAYNEEGVIKELAARLTAVMDRLAGDAEAILVDDGSRDGTRAGRGE